MSPDLSATAPRFWRSRVARLLAVAVAAAVIVPLVLTLTSTPSTAIEGVGIFEDSETPEVATFADPEPVELGVRVTVAVDTQVLGVRFYKGPENRGRHVVSLWSTEGELLARTDAVSGPATGWQEAAFAEPVPVVAGRTYVASYTAPAGHYAVQSGGFAVPRVNGPVSVAQAGGVFTYEPGAFPDRTYRDNNYFVDVVVATPRGAPAPTPAPVPSATPGDVDPDPTGEPVDLGTPLDLPRIPWEGGPEYWTQFAKADAAGWSDPSFFPVVAWFNGISSAGEATFDKALGINTYMGMWEGTPYHLFEDSGVFWVGPRLNETFTDSSRNWVGHLLDDEVDGRFTPEAGRAHLQQIIDALPADDGRFRYANFTQMVISKEMNASDASRFVNDYTDVASLDMYWYTIPFCSLTPYRDVYLTSVEPARCRTASSYGKTMESLRMRDAEDGKLQPLWQFVENLNGGPAEGTFSGYIEPGQLKGAVMSSIINEARGIVYFNQSFSGPCTGGGIFRQAQYASDFCAAPQVDAAREVNHQVHDLAPIINSQSYDYTFGPGLDTMLKSDAGHVYVFAMVDGSSAPGTRTFQLPDGVTGRTAEVLFEGRSVQIGADGSFADDFEQEFSYHIYRVAR